jgi:signal transduction histidine kinase
MDKIRVLFIEDSPDDYELVVRELKKGSMEIYSQRVDSAEAMTEALTQPWDVVISDYSLPGFSGLQALQIFKTTGLDIPFIIISGTVGEEVAVDTIRQGVSDYIMKNQLKRLLPSVQRELQAAAERLKNREVQKTLRETESQLHHVQKMEAIGLLAGGIAHDFNNMLAVFKIYFEKLKQVPNPEVQNYVEKVLKVHSKAVALTHQLLIFSRRQVLEPQVVHLGQVLNDLGEMLQGFIGSNVVMTMDVDPEIKNVLCDRSQLEQVLMNLVINSRDAMPDGGRLRIQAKNVEFETVFRSGTRDLPPGQYILIEVADSGVGIEKEVLARIFEPFFTTKAHGKGTGLGLAIIYGIVHQNHGCVAVNSKVGEGTSIQIYLPVAGTFQLASASPTEIRTPTTIKKRILVVDDEGQIVDSVAEILMDQGYHVLKASNGFDALRQIQSCDGEIDLIISDVIMPTLGGRDFFKQVRQSWPHIPFVFMSGYASNLIQELAVNVHSPVSIDLLEKPFSMSVLLDRVRRSMDIQ